MNPIIENTGQCGHSDLLIGLVLWSSCFFHINMSIEFDLNVDMHVDIIWVSKSNETLAENGKKKCFSGYTRIHYKLTLILIHFAFIRPLMI